MAGISVYQSIVAGESNKQAVSYAKISAMYLLYQIARKSAYSQEQEVNEYIYQLKN